jgi:hypothetical protein
MQSYDYFVTYQAITIDSRLTWRARRKDGGFYWKTWLLGVDKNLYVEPLIWTIEHAQNKYRYPPDALKTSAGSPCDAPRLGGEPRTAIVRKMKRRC